MAGYPTPSFSRGWLRSAGSWSKPIGMDRDSPLQHSRNRRRGLLRVLRWVPLLVVLADAILVLSHVIDLSHAVMVLFCLEVLLAVVVLSELIAFRSSYLGARREQLSRMAALAAALDAVLPGPLAVAVRYEFRMFATLGRALHRKADVPAGSTAIPYARYLRPLLTIMLAIGVLEIAVTTLVVRFIIPWPVVRWLVLAASLYALMWITSFLLALGQFPHTVGADELRVRFAFFTDLALPTNLVRDARSEHHGGYSRTVQVASGVLAVAVSGSTNVTVAFRGPYPLLLRGRAESIQELRLYADDPRAAVTAINGSRRDDPTPAFIRNDDGAV